MEFETMVPITVEEDDKLEIQNGFEGKIRSIDEADEAKACLSSPDKFAEPKPNFKSRAEQSIDKLGKRIGHRWLLLIAMLLFVFLVLVLFLLLWPRIPHHALVPKCATPHCLRTAATYVETMNSSVDPCVDPWQWACGSWLNESTTKIRQNWGKRDELWLLELTKVRDIVSSMTDIGGPDSVNWKLKTLYDSCMAVEDVEGDHDYPLKKLIFELGGWSVLREWSHRSWDATKVLSRLHSRHGASPFFSVTMGQDPTRPGALLLTLAPGGLGLPDRSYYYAGPHSEIVMAYKRLMRDTVSLLGANSRDAGIFADDVFGYEQRLASITPERSELMTRAPLVIPLGDLKMSTLSLPIQDTLSALFPRGRINDATRILLPSPFYVRHLSAVISTTDRSILNNYLIWTLVREYLPYLSSSYIQVLHEYTSKLTGSSYQAPRWEFCTSLLYKMLPLAVNAIVENCTREYVNKDYKHQRIHNMFLSLKTATMNKIKDAQWINNPLENHLLQKVDVMVLEVELPSFTLQPSYLKEHYSTLLIQKHNLFQNIGFGFDFDRDRKQKIYLSSLKSEERLIPPEIDLTEVQYYESRNAIIVPRILASPPYYHPHYPISIQFGRLGVQIGIAMAGVILPSEPLAVPDGRVDTHLSPIDDSIIGLSKQATNFSQNCIQNVLTFKHGVNRSVANLTKLNTLIHLTGVKIALDGMQWRLHNDVHSFDVHEHIPGLDIYEDDAIFSLSYAQDQCKLDTKSEVTMETSVKLQLQKKLQFDAAWFQISKFQEYLGCSRHKICSEVL